ncbi:MAG: hypothetical protein ACOC91_01100 [bacterium]
MASMKTGRNTYAIDIVERRDVENYASGHLKNSEMVNLVEEALLEDGAARDVVREKLREGATGHRASHTQGLLFEALQDLHTTAHSCSTLAETYSGLARHADTPAVRRFLEGRRAAFHRAAELLNRPLRDQPAEVPDACEQGVLLARESRESLVRRLDETPAAAICDLNDLHAPVMLGLRTLVHLPWPLETKLLIADVYALLRDELETGAWRLCRG